MVKVPVVYHPDYYADIGAYVFPTKKFSLVFEAIQRNVGDIAECLHQPSPATREQLLRVQRPRRPASGHRLHIDDGPAAIGFEGNGLGSGALRHDPPEVVQDRRVGSGDGSQDLDIAFRELSLSRVVPAGFRQSGGEFPLRNPDSVRVIRLEKAVFRLWWRGELAQAEPVRADPPQGLKNQLPNPPSIARNTPSEAVPPPRNILPRPRIARRGSFRRFSQKLVRNAG
jgi:hypothetical protein